MSGNFFSGIRSSKISLLIILLTAFFVLDIKSQALNPNKALSQFTHDKWGDEQNFISGGSLSIVQDKDGYLWIGSFNGVFRFDGVNFKQYSKELVSEIPNNDVPTLCVGIDNEIWAGSNGGGLYLFKNGLKKTFNTKDGLPSNIIREVYKDRKNRILIGTSNGLSIYDQGKFTNYNTFITQKDTLNEAVINTIIELETGEILVGTNIGLFAFKNKYFYSISLDANYGMIEITSIIETAQQRILIGTYGSGIFELIDEDVNPFYLPSGIDKVSHLMQDSNGAIWISHQAGLLRYFQGIFSVLPSSNGNYEDAVECVIEDREGSIWFTRYNGGIDRLKDGIFLNLSTYEGLSDNTIHCIFEDFDNSKWIGTANGLNHLKENNIEYYTKENGKLLGNLVRDVFRDSKGRLWIATYSGLTKIEDNKTKHYTVKDGLTSDLVRLIFEDSKGRLWIGTRNGLNRYENGGFIQYTNESDLSNSFILSLLETTDGALWIGTSGGGINILENGQFHQKTTLDGLPSNVIFRMHQDKEGSIWIATNNGLCKFDDGKFFSSFKTDNGYLNAALYQVLEDKNEEFWITSDFGIINVKKEELNNYLKKKDKKNITEIHYKQLDGLKRSECTGAAKSIVASDSTIWFATLGSVAIINVDDSLYNTTPPIVVIEQILADQALIPASNESEIQIDKSIKNLRIEYTALSLKTPTKVKFKYRLAGLDKEWILVNNIRSVTYQNLDPGPYTFELMATNNDGLWSTKATTQSFYIVPKFYQTNLFILLSSIFLILLILGINTLRIRTMKREKVKLQQLVEERTSEVIAQNEEISTQRDNIEERNKRLEEAQNIITLKNEELRTANTSLEDLVKHRTQELENSNEKLFEKNRELDLFIYKSAHDLRGPIARIQGLISLGKTDTNNSSIYFEKLEDTAKNMSSLLTRTIRVHDVNSRKLDVHEINLQSMISAIVKKLDKDQVIQIANTSSKDIIIQSDTYLLQTALENLLENAIKFSKPKEHPSIAIETTLSDQLVSVIIKNNGLSIPADFNSSVFKIFTVANDKLEGAGLGLYEVKIIMERLKGNISLLKSTPEETIFILQFPV